MPTNTLTINSDFPARLRDARERGGMTQAELARRLGYTQRGNISPYERGKVSPTLDLCERMAEELAVDPEWLAGWSDEGGPGGFATKGRRFDITDDLYRQAATTMFRAALRQGWSEVQIPSPARHLAYQVGDVIVLSNCNGELGKVRAYPSGKMRALTWPGCDA